MKNLQELYFENELKDDEPLPKEVIGMAETLPKLKVLSISWYNISGLNQKKVVAMIQNGQNQLLSANFNGKQEYRNAFGKEKKWFQLENSLYLILKNFLIKTQNLLWE